MARRCDRCRASYESGADYGGHDYCMTCYTQVKQAEEQKRAAAERLKEQKMEYLRKQVHDDYARQDMGRERKAREFAEESRRLALLDQKKRREDPMEEMRKRKKWENPYIAKNQDAGVERQLFNPLGRKKKSASAPALQKKDEYASYAAHGLPHGESDGKKIKQQPRALEQASLSLSVAEGLPVSLSIGQKQVQAFLLGKNASKTPIAVGTEVSILDSQKISVAWKAEPRTCTIGPEGEMKIKVTFDLPEDAARGMLSFTALLKENAIYIDRQAAQSNTISLTSQVKSSMDLQYKRGSAAFDAGALLLSFDNVGESGGILEKASYILYFPQDAIGKKASLASRTKIKGGEKGILLSFSPAEEAAISKLELNFAGTDSNGKPYSLKRRISLDKAPGDEGKGKAEGAE